MRTAVLMQGEQQRADVGLVAEESPERWGEKWRTFQIRRDHKQVSVSERSVTDLRDHEDDRQAGI